MFRAVTDVDALVEFAQRSLDTISEPTRRNRDRINLYLDLDTTLHTHHHVALPDSIRDHITCDGTINPVYVRNATPISVGRTQRIVPDRTRRTVLHRDGHQCQIPGCTATRGLDIHHIVHWAHGGRTDTANLIVICARHHRMHHHRLPIHGNANQPHTLEFHDTHRRPIRASGANPHPPNGPPPPIPGTDRHPIGERFQSRWVSFNHPTNTHPHPDTG